MQEYTTYVRQGVVAKTLSVSPTTVKKWADAGLISYVKTPAGQRRYDLSGYLAVQEAARKPKEGPRVVLTAVPPKNYKKAPAVKSVAPASAPPRAEGMLYQAKGLGELFGAPSSGPDLAATINALAPSSTGPRGASLGRDGVSV